MFVNCVESRWLVQQHENFTGESANSVPIFTDSNSALQNIRTRGSGQGLWCSIQAYGHSIPQQSRASSYRNGSVCYISIQENLADIIRSLCLRKVPIFRRRYRLAHIVIFFTFFIVLFTVFLLQGVGTFFPSRFLPLGLLRNFLVRPAGIHAFLWILAVYRTFGRIAVSEEVFLSLVD